MPIKKSAQSHSSARAEAAVCCMPSVRHVWKWFLAIAAGTAIVVLAYMVFVLFQYVLRLTYAVDSLSSRVAPSQPSVVVPTGKVMQYSETAVPGLWLAYTPCPETFTGSCDDASLYKLAKDGSKEVVVPSVRAIASAPQTNELLQPMSASADGKLLVLGAWAYGSSRNAGDKRIWLYDLSKGAVVASSNNVPSNAIFSPDYTYAAYAVTDNNDIRDVMIVNLFTDKTVSGAQADEGRTFKDQNGQAELVWKDAKNLVVSVFSVPSGTGASSIPVKTGEKIIKVK